MYRCCNVKRFLIMLLCDLIAVGLLMLLFQSSLFRTEGVSEPADQGVSLPVLMYHSVFSGRHSDYVIPPEVLESDLQYLSAKGYQAVLVSDLIRYVYHGTPLPEKPVMITFDDGYYNNLEQCLPLLEKYDMCAVISVVGSYIVNQAEQDSHVTAYSYLTFPEIRTLLDSGRIEIGNHTYDLHSHTHRQGCGILPEESESAYRELLRSDLEQLQSLLASQVQIRPVVFTYP
ncbi:polysaccharide deacetylase family protein, partial [Ruminococcus sp.]|uniref:polysaccharide deacetylase family protein n=1 Tax=Ruminococcus sp. TaxID=41978 RepID=UPI003F0EF10D